MLTPMIPEMIGLPPTKDTAFGRISSNQGFNINDKTIDMALKVPKKHPNAISNLIQLGFFNILQRATVKGSLFIFYDSEGGVGGLFLWKSKFNPKHMYPIIAWNNIKLYVKSFPY